MANWADVSKEARETMDFIGDFGPTINPFDRAVKGWVAGADGEVQSAYLGSDELREMAAHFHEVADWLDARNSEAARPAPAGSEESEETR